MERDLETVRKELKITRHKFLNGDVSVKITMDNLAIEAANLYNFKASEIAKKMNMRPRFTTPDRIMRQGEFLR
jgi:hypothetical protein